VRCMITIHFETQHLQEIRALVPKEQEHVKELMGKGTLEAIYLSSDRTTVWLVMKGESQEQIQQELTAFPLYPYMKPQLTPLV
jgi:muconolactone delta-isomerase